ncbi:MAG: hypothetical protein IIY62_02815 [Kiritimatiellae bacterium]|nr:hypothetical protein [Kiritimatiellia bacterium]
MFLQKFVQSAARGGFAAWRRGATSFAAAIGLSFAVGAATVDLAELTGDVILADGDPFVDTPSELLGREGFFETTVIGSSALNDWTSPVELEDDGSGTWGLPTGALANFFRLRLTEK